MWRLGSFNDAMIPLSEDAEESKLSALNDLWGERPRLPFGVCTILQEIESTILEDKIVHQVGGEGSREAKALLKVGEISVGTGLALLDDRLRQGRVDRREAH